MTETTQQRIERIALNTAPLSYGYFEPQDIEAMIRSALTAFAEEEANKWQPIETAPKCLDYELSGPRIIGWSPEWTEPFPVKWCPGRPFPHWTVDSGAVTIHPPSLWQPLPEPPKED